jgi:hypothetical protein
VASSACEKDGIKSVWHNLGPGQICILLPFFPVSSSVQGGANQQGSQQTRASQRPAPANELAWPLYWGKIIRNFNKP